MTGAGDMDGDDDRVTAAEYVLGLLTADIARAFERRVDEEPALAADVAQWEDDFAAFTDDIPEVEPPARVFDAISARLFGTTERPPLLARFGMMKFILGAVAAAVVALAVVESGLLGPEMRPEYQAVVVAEDASLRFDAAYDADTGALTLTRVAGDAAAGRSLEFWLIAGDAAPVSVMVWPSDATTEEIVLPAPIAAALPGGTLAISDEPEGGSPTGAPTGAVLATGQVQEI